LEGGCHETLWVWGGFPVPVGHHRKTGIEEGEELVDRQDRFELDHTAAFSSLRVPTTLYSAPSKLPRAMWIITPRHVDLVSQVANIFQNTEFPTRY
jgi:hypothetical protein